MKTTEIEVPYLIISTLTSVTVSELFARFAAQQGIYMSSRGLKEVMVSQVGLIAYATDCFASFKFHLRNCYTPQQYNDLFSALLDRTSLYSKDFLNANK